MTVEHDGLRKVAEAATPGLVEHCERQAFLIETDCIDSGQAIDALNQAAQAIATLTARLEVREAEIAGFHDERVDYEMKVLEVEMEAVRLRRFLASLGYIERLAPACCIEGGSDIAGCSCTEPKHEPMFFHVGAERAATALKELAR